MTPTQRERLEIASLSVAQKDALHKIREEMAKMSGCVCAVQECGYHKFKAGWDSAVAHLQPLIEACEKSYRHHMDCYPDQRYRDCPACAAKLALTKVFGDEK